MRGQALNRIAIALVLSAFQLPASAQDPDPAPPETPAENAGEEEGWLDAGYRGIDTRAQDLADWIDGFFGHAREVPDSAESQVRLRPAYQWNEEDGSDWKLRATGKLRLSAANERLSVVFLGDQSSSDDEFYDPAIASDSSGGAGLQYQIRDREKSSAFLFAGVKSGPKGKLGARYRRVKPLPGSNRLRFSQDVFWIGGDGFGTLTRLDFDHFLSEQTLLRWANRAEIREDSEGWEWRTRVAWIQKLSQREALRFFGFVRGQSDPRVLKSRGFGTSYRQRFLRDWLFLEFEPRYAWRKRENESNRDGVFQIEVRIEAVIGDL